MPYDAAQAPVIVRRYRDVLFVTLNRPDTRNALAPEVVDELAAAVDAARRDTSLRALVLRGARASSAPAATWATSGRAAAAPGLDDPWPRATACSAISCRPWPNCRCR